METTSVRLYRSFKVPLKRLFDAWTTPEDLVQWAWGSLGEGVTAEVDPRPGGKFRVTTRKSPDPNWPKPECNFHGAYMEFLPNKRLVYSLNWDAPMGYENTHEKVTVEFGGLGDTSEFWFLHEGIPDDGHSAKAHEDGWRETFDYLERLLETGSAESSATA
jgi:uncharacterized protein YndB with AHSA1/START domain